MIWFWFNWVLHLSMLLANAVLWLMAKRLTHRWCRVLVGVFLAVQTAALFSALAGYHWDQHSPKPIFILVFVWHYCALPILVLLGLFHYCAKKVPGVSQLIRRNNPTIAATGANSVTRREFLGTCIALTPPLFNIGLTGMAFTQINQFRVRRFELSIPALPQALDGTTIAHLTDIHVGKITSGRVLREMVKTTNALRPDLVLLTGDLIDYDLADLPEAVALVNAMESRYGLWMVEGNHDLAQDGGEFERRVRAANIPLLVNQSAVANVRGYPVQLFGLGWLDGEGQHRDQVTALQLRTVLKQRHPDAFPILLAHHPHAFDAAVEMNLPLTLAGHTHGGQWMLDDKHGVGSVLFRYWSGLYARGNSQMIVSNGVGNVCPIRINAPAEIVHLTLHRSEPLS